MLAQTRSSDILEYNNGNSSSSPCIALRRAKHSMNTAPINIPAPPRLATSSPRSLHVPEGSQSVLSSSCKLTGSPGYIATSQESPSPTKVHPSKPHHVRGGSINSDLSDVAHMDQIIPLQPCDSEILVPLLHRHLEMKELIESNPAHFCRLRNAIGTRTFVKCLDLWTETTRAEINDFNWLKTTQQLIRGNDNWIIWCEVVGWDHHAPLLEKAKKDDAPDLSVTGLRSPKLMHSRKHSGASQLSPGDTIEEEMEE